MTGDELEIKAMTIQSIEIPDHVLTALQLLTPEQRQQVFALVEGLSQEKKLNDEPQASTPKKQRVFGQFAGKIWMSDDFDDPLPDAFGLGDSENQRRNQLKIIDSFGTIDYDDE
jgi:Protein of unknown function (DUF2281)